MLNLQIHSRRIELVSFSHHILCTHHPSGFPLARPTSFSFVLALSFCLKTAENGRKLCSLLNFPNTARNKMAHSSSSSVSKRLQRVLGVSQCTLGLQPTCKATRSESECMEVGRGTPERWGTSPTRGKEILVFTCNPGDAGWGPKCNYLGAKCAHKQRTIVYSDEAAFRINVVLPPSKTLVWFGWLAWLFDSTPKLSPALSISSAFWLFWWWNSRNNSPRSSDLITPVRRTTLLCSFHMEKTHPTVAGYPDRLPGNPPWWGTPPNMWTRSRK